MKNKILVGLLLAIAMVLLCSCGKHEDVNSGDNVDNPTIDNQDAVSIAISEENFPDSDFRAYISGNFDSNGDGSLDGEEISKVKRINVSNTGGYHYEITSLDGIKNFTELEYLECKGNQITSLDVSGMAKLKELSANSNQLASLNISGCAELEKLACEVNSLTSLDVSACPELKLLDCINNQLPSLNVSGCAELEQLLCISNALTELDVSGCPKLVRLACDDNKLTSLDLSGCPELEELICEYNGITELDVSKCPKLAENMFSCDESVEVIR